MTTVTTICQVCGKIVRTEQANNLAAGAVNHGYCRPCFEKRMEEIRNLPKPKPQPKAVQP